MAAAARWAARGNAGDRPARAGRQIDGRKPAGRREPRAQDDVTVERGTRGLGDRIMLERALRENGRDERDAAVLRVPRAFEQARLGGNDRRGESRRARPAHRPPTASLARGRCRSGEAIEDEQHVQAALA